MEIFKELQQAIDNAENEMALFEAGESSEFRVNLSLIRVIQVADRIDTSLAMSLHEMEQAAA